MLLAAALSAAPIPASWGANAPNNAGIALAGRSHFYARPKYREQLEACFTDTLECGEPTRVPSTKELGPISAYRFVQGGAISVEFTESALDEGQARWGAWLELRSSDAERMRERVLAAGYPQVRYPATKLFHFQAPGGQVFSIVAV